MDGFASTPQRTFEHVPGMKMSLHVINGCGRVCNFKVQTWPGAARITQLASSMSPCGAFHENQLCNTLPSLHASWGFAPWQLRHDRR